MIQTRDHGGALDAAMARFGGRVEEWLDLSTGINPVPYPIPDFSPRAWAALPDRNAFSLLEARARKFWSVPDVADVLVAPGASSLIARLPSLAAPGRVSIPGPTYNEHGAAFSMTGWTLADDGRDAQVLVQPNNPDGHLWQHGDVTAPFAIIDESFCDVTPDHSLIDLAGRPGTVVLKSFGKFWGLAGARLGFAIGDPEIVALLREMLGPWQVSGPALEIGAEALADPEWADETRARLTSEAIRLDMLLTSKGAEVVGGTPLFRLYRVEDAVAAQTHLAQAKIWSRVFPYSTDWIRLGLPHPDRWAQLEAAF